MTMKGYTSRETSKYAFSSKIKCAFCGTNFCRRHSSYSKKHPQYNIYWTCFKKREHSDACSDSVGLSETKLEQAFVMLYNNIVKNKHKTKTAEQNALFNIRFKFGFGYINIAPVPEYTQFFHPAVKFYFYHH